MQADLGLFDPPADIAPVIDQLWDDPETYCFFDHPEFHCFVHYDPSRFAHQTPWVKALSRQGDVRKVPITSASFAECLRSDDPVYDYELVEGEPPITPAADGVVRDA